MSYGCYNRKPLRSHQTVQAGWHHLRYQEATLRVETRMPVMKLIPVPMSKDCQHTLDAPNDKKCLGCRWQA
jgi:hypothetical protein